MVHSKNILALVIIKIFRCKRAGRSGDRSTLGNKGKGQAMWGRGLNQSGDSLTRKVGARPGRFPRHHRNTPDIVFSKNNELSSDLPRTP